MHPKNLLIAVALAIALIAGLLAFTLFEAPQTPSTSPPPLTATLFPAPVPLPEFELVDQAGVAARRDVFEGHWDLVFFGFTSCPDICPITLSVLADAKTKLANAGHSPLPRIVLVSVDPERDTPQKLAEYVAYFGEDNLGLTGDIEEIRSFTKEVGVFFEKREVDGEDYTVDHSAVVLLIDPDARLRGLFSSPHKAENFVNDLRVITAEG
ncbi:MAG: SCO family protein [Woeseiaceae bacterium]|nr:SCO family protein [Woeseiaceae bacterium]